MNVRLLRYFVFIIRLAEEPMVYYRVLFSWGHQRSLDTKEIAIKLLILRILGL